MPILPGVPSSGGFRLPLDELDAFLQERVGAHAHTPDNFVPTNSLEQSGDDVQLVGDEASPGNSEYYGTDGGGTKGFHPLPSSEGLVLLSSQTVASPVAFVDFTTLIDATYHEYIFSLFSVIPATDAVEFWVRTSTDGGSNFDIGASDYAWGLMSSAGDASSGGDTKVKLAASGVGSAVDEDGWSGWVHLLRPSEAVHTWAKYSGWYADGLNVTRPVLGAGRRLSAADVDAVRFLFSSGDIESGVFRLYGVVKA